MGNVIFPCGCKFPTIDPDERDFIVTDPIHDDFPLLSLNVETIPLDCQATWELLKSGNCVGVFQLETNLGRHWCKSIKPNNVSELADIISLIRPGCLQSYSGIPPKNMTQRYTDRKNNKEEITYYHKALEPILKDTYGVLIYQEESMRIARDIAGFSLEEADSLRKGLGKKDAELISKLQTKFVEGCKTQGIVTEDEGKEIFEWIRAGQRYGFNKSHGLSYAIDGYWSAYCKVHFPLQFFCSYLKGAKHKQKPQDEIRILVSDAKKFNIEVLPPRLLDKTIDFYIKNHKIYFGLGNIKKIGESSVEGLLTQIDTIEQQIGLLSTWMWLDYLVFLCPKISTSTNESLILSGAIDNFGISRQRMLFESSIYDKLTPLEQTWIQTNYWGVPPAKRWNSLRDILTDVQITKKNGGGCHSERRSLIIRDFIKSLDNPPHALDDTPEYITWQEEQLMGVSLTITKLDNCMDASRATCTCQDISNGYNGYMLVAAEIREAKIRKIKNGPNAGKEMCSLILEDSTGTLEIPIFSQEFEVYNQYCYDGNTILAQCDRGKYVPYTISVKKVFQI